MKHSQRTANCPSPRRARTQALFEPHPLISLFPFSPLAGLSPHPAVTFSPFLCCSRIVSPTCVRTYVYAHIRIYVHIRPGTSRLLQSRMQLLVLAAAKSVCDEKGTARRDPAILSDSANRGSCAPVRARGCGKTCDV